MIKEGIKTYSHLCRFQINTDWIRKSEPLLQNSGRNEYSKNGNLSGPFYTFMLVRRLRPLSLPRASTLTVTTLFSATLHVTHRTCILRDSFAELLSSTLLLFCSFDWSKTWLKCCSWAELATLRWKPSQKMIPIFPLFHHLHVAAVWSLQLALFFENSITQRKYLWFLFLRVRILPVDRRPLNMLWTIMSTLSDWNYRIWRGKAFKLKLCLQYQILNNIPIDCHSSRNYRGVTESE